MKLKDAPYGYDLVLLESVGNIPINTIGRKAYILGHLYFVVRNGRHKGSYRMDNNIKVKLLEEPMLFTMKSNRLNDVAFGVPVRLLDSLGNLPVDTIGYVAGYHEGDVYFVVISGAPLGITFLAAMHPNPRVEILAPRMYTMELK